MLKRMLVVASVMLFGISGAYSFDTTLSGSEERLETIEKAIILLAAKISLMDEEKANTEDIKEIRDKLDELKKQIEGKKKTTFMGSHRLPTT